MLGIREDANVFLRGHFSVERMGIGKDENETTSKEQRRVFKQELG